VGITGTHRGTVDRLERKSSFAELVLGPERSFSGFIEFCSGPGFSDLDHGRGCAQSTAQSQRHRTDDPAIAGCVLVIPDVPEGRLVRVYSLQEIATEKILALADRARNEPRDLYDLWFLITGAGIQVDDLEHAIREKVAFRGKPHEGLQESILRKEARLKALWSRRRGAEIVIHPFGSSKSPMACAPCNATLMCTVELFFA
jgi:hypothetical protein